MGGFGWTFARCDFGCDFAGLPCRRLRYVVVNAAIHDGRSFDASILRQLLIGLAMISVMLLRPRGLWPAPEYGKGKQQGVITLEQCVDPNVGALFSTECNGTNMTGHSN
jgi:hypothetical protein